MPRTLRHFRTLFLVSLICSAVGLPTSNAQNIEVPDEPAEWGEVSVDVLEMDHYPADSNATAVILSDYGETSFRPNGRLAFERHRRVKILSEDAYDDWGTVEIPYYAADGTERVDRIDGQTMVLGADGSVETYELDSDDVFEEDIDGDYERITFTLPNLQPGAVIEYSYRIRSYQPRFLRSWAFQATEPTLYSEYETSIPEVFEYVFLSQGEHPYAVEEDDRINFGHNLRATKHRWVMTEVPALREEPFMTTLENYRSKIRFQLQAVNLPNRPRTPVMSSWPELAEDLLDHDNLGDQIGDHRSVREEARSIIDGIEDPMQQMNAIYDAVATSMSWNGMRRVYTGSDLDDVLERRSGTSAEINLLLVSMLQEADLALAAPVLISTRDHGHTVPLYPFLSQFNDLIVVASTDEQVMFLDATSPHRPAGVLPLRALNDNGFMLDEENAQWVDIPRNAPDQRSFFTQGELHADGTVEANVQATYSGPGIAPRRSDYESADDDASFVASTLFDRYDNAEVGAPRVEIPDARHESVVVRSDVTIPRYANTAADFIYLNPMLLSRWEENPFQAEERTYPVDFGYPGQVEQVISLQLPEGYVIEEMPGNMQVQLPNEGGAYTRLTQEQFGRLTLRSVYTLNQPVIGSQDYEGLRDFFARIVAIESEPIVLRKEAAEAEEATESSSEAASQ